MSDITNNIKVDYENDYPLATKRSEWIKTPTGKNLEDITLEAIIDEKVKAEDVRISRDTLELQAQVAEGSGRCAIARNFRRAAELISIPDERILEIYNALRPYRSTKNELLAIADELEEKYDAKVNADFIREAAEVYSKRNKVRIED
ncbi:diol dehydratase small subunit [Clostridium pasteurianum]|uniref:diol dehydratase small subunit n=1 Tax=Clostridium pasteurianum TaxID=1501 RepID=UPI0022609998|nr:diol dehydratase small subunit [Clostridium pasteurianum]UZW12617.1 diol dehydratase small subunit [Clostridium pasteurianum]